MGNKIVMGIGAAVLVFLIIFCLVPTNAVSDMKTVKTLYYETHYVQGTYTAYLPVHTKYRPAEDYAVATHRDTVGVTQYQEAPVTVGVWETEEVPVEKHVPLLIYLIKY